MLALIAAALLLGLRASGAIGTPAGAIVAIAMPSAQPTPPAREPPPVRTHRAAARDDPAPAGLKADASAIFAPRLPPIVTPPPVIAAPEQGSGAGRTNGASDRTGAGPGAGGQGDGHGGGGEGGDGLASRTRPVLIRGRLRFSDLPGTMQRGEQPGEVTILFVVLTDGRVGDCQVTSLSGPAELGDLVCRLVQRRFRYRPSMDENGEPVEARMTESHGWSFPAKPSRSPDSATLPPEDESSRPAG